MGNEVRAINTPYISGLDMAIRVKEERIGKEDKISKKES